MRRPAQEPGTRPDGRSLACAGRRWQIMEAAGIEPASRDAPSWASTRVVRRLMSPAPLRRTGSSLASSTVSRRGWAEQPPHDQPAVLRLVPPQARGPRRHYLVLRQRGSSACWHLVCSSRIYEVPGPRRATAGRVGIRSKPIAPVSCRGYRRQRGEGQAAPATKANVLARSRQRHRERTTAAPGSPRRSTCASQRRTRRAASAPACGQDRGSTPTKPADPR